MSYEYTINDLASKSNVSLQSCYGLIKKNREFVDNNSVRKHRKIYYNQAVMDFFIAYYQPVEEVPPKAEKKPHLTSSTEEPSEDQLIALQRKIDALQAEIDALKKDLASTEEERKELIRQNGALILTLQQEKQEKQLFLPSPKRTFSEKLKSIFTHKS